MIVLIVEDLSISLKPQYSAKEILSYKTLHKLSVLKLGPDRPVEPGTGQVAGPSHIKKPEI